MEQYDVAILLVDTEVVSSRLLHITDRKSSLHILFPKVVLICVVWELTLLIHQRSILRLLLFVKELSFLQS